MKKQYKYLIRQIRICSLVMGLLLQGCNKRYKPPGLVVDKQIDNIQLARTIQASSKKVRNRKLDSEGPLYQKKKQLQVIKIENPPLEDFSRNQQTEYIYASTGKRRFEGVVDHDQKEIKRKKEGVKRRGQVTKRKRAKVQENKKEIGGQETEKKSRLENPGKTKKKNKSKKEIRKERKVSIPNSPGTRKKRVKKKRESVKDEKNDTIIELSLVNFPPEVLETILVSFSYEKIMIARQISRLFYALITGYNQVGVVGVENKPDRSVTQSAWSYRHAIDFRKLTEKQLASMPSFVFYQLMREVSHLPQAYWPYIADTQIHTVDFWEGNLGPVEVEMLGKYLQKSKVCKAYLWHNHVRTMGAQAFLENSKSSNIKEVDLSDNQIEDKELGELAKFISMPEINLSDNKITAKGIVKFARNLPKSVPQKLDLTGNEIRDEGMVDMIENLRDKTVKKLYLACNKITDEGAMKAAKKIKETNLEELCLATNQLTNKGAVKIVKGCQGEGAKMKKLDLSFNRRITNEGVVKIAEHVERTVLEEIDLRQYKPISAETQELLKAKCPHIKWIFT
ncbi:MAG: hypothetical protein BGO68_00420 [Candidatus Amoebophilus sp. 36-38]|nr:MAG: hypothetical protein BGO68_00420 [Candidatus Amoebophilus sp. 36-38]